MKMNVTSFVGRLVSDPELKQTPNGIPVCNFTLAVKRPKGKATTDFFGFVVWRQSAEFLCRFGKKGNYVAATGVLTTRNYEDKNGNKRVAYEILVDALNLISEGNSSAPKQVEGQWEKNAPGPFSVSQDAFEEMMTDDSELPF
jgi:single-strand DNA-binding protein